MEYENCCNFELSAEPDWADELATQWLAVVKGMHKEKKRPKDGISHEIVRSTGKRLTEAVRENYNEVDFDDFDYKFSQALQLNTWYFSVAKNYNDIIALNNLLVDEKGNLRPWHEFKRMALDVVGRSNRHLKTEYNTIVAASQAARMWQEIQRDKHIFPFVQFWVTLDKHTSDICEPLHNVIVTVDDPMLQRFFPPNHFNCRTWVRKLRRGRPTKNVQWPDIPEAFMQNVGESGEIFTAENSYFKNTPKRVLNIAEKIHRQITLYNELKSDPNYYDVEMNNVGGVKAIHIHHQFHPATGRYEKEACTILFNAGNVIILESEQAENGIKTPDGSINTTVMDIKTVLGYNGVIGKHTITNKIQDANGQGCEIVVLYFPKGKSNLFNPNKIKDAYFSAQRLIQKRNEEILIKEIWVIIDSKIEKFSY